jgi:hypothetical protein
MPELLRNALLYCSATELLLQFVIVAQHITGNIIASAILYLHTAVHSSD